MVILELLDVGGGAAGGVNADEVLADLLVGRNGCVDALDDEEMILFGDYSVGRELAEAEGRRAPAGEHDRQAAVGAEDGGRALIDVGEAAVARLRLFEATFVEAYDGGLADERRAVPLVGLAAEMK